MVLTAFFLSALTTETLASPSAAELRETPYALKASMEAPTWVVAEQGRSTWTIRMTSDGARAFAHATVDHPPPVYEPPGTPGYQNYDFRRDGTLILWRTASLAVEYDPGPIRSLRQEGQFSPTVPLASRGTDPLPGAGDFDIRLTSFTPTFDRSAASTVQAKVAACDSE